MASMGEEEAPPDTLPNLARRNPGIRGWPPSGGHTGTNRTRSSLKCCYIHHYEITLKGAGKLHIAILEHRVDEIGDLVPEPKYGRTA